MLAHRSQIADDRLLPDHARRDASRRAFGTEWFIADGPAPAEGSLAAELFEPVR